MFKRNSHDYSMAIHHYIISGVDPEREPYLKNEFQKWGLEDKDITWVKGSNKDDLSNELIRNICSNVDGMKKGEISCTYKHYLSLQDMIRNQREYAVIMEDDVNFRDNIQERLNKYMEELDERYPDWDVLFDGDINSYYGPACQYKEEYVVPGRLVYPKSHKDEVEQWGMGGSTRGANYYLINLKTAKILYENFLPFTKVVDHEYNHQFRKLDFNVYWSMPPFVHKMRRRSTSQFDN